MHSLPHLRPAIPGAQRSRPHKRRFSAGVSLVSMMVGLTISSIVVLSMMTMFKVVVRTMNSSGQGAQSDAQLMAGILRASMAMQEAGYGIGTPTFGTQLVVLSGASVTSNTLSGSVASSGTAGNAVVWTANTGVAAQCSALMFDSATDGTGGLKFLGPVACNTGTVANWHSLSWTTSAWADSTASNNAKPMAFTATQETCKPFGLTGTSGALTLTTASTNSNGASVQEKQCLINFQ